MKSSSFLVFFSIVLIIYGFINFYLLRRGWQSLPQEGYFRSIFLLIFIFLVVAYPLGRLAENISRYHLTEFLVYIGSFYLGLMVFALFLTLGIDLVRLGNRIFHYFPAKILHSPERAAMILFFIVSLTSIVLTIAGHINALHPRIRTVNIRIDKKANSLEKLNIVMASDIHLGTVIRNSRLLGIVERIKKLEPDLVLLPGDIVDEDVAAVSEQNMAETFQKLQARYGVFAVTGNHEYFSGIDESVNYIQEGNVTMLQDTVIKIADSFYLAGRKDRMAIRFAGGRKPLDKIVNGIDKRLPVILMDHQPFRLDEAQRLGVDLQVSGHTHHGQLFPFNLITNKVYELSWGYSKKGNTHFYVSCGVGTWGPPVRLGNRPEIVRIIIQFQSNQN